MFNGYTPEQRAGFPGDAEGFPGALTTNEWLGERTYDPVYNIPNWRDWSPRMGMSYDLFGNGRTAIKAQLGKYVSKLGTDLTEGLNPIATSVVSATRNWDDLTYPVGDPRRGNFVPDCDLGNFTINGECGAISNNNFGRNNPNATRWDPAVLEGLGQARFELGFLDGNPARTAPRLRRDRRILLEQRRLHPADQQPAARHRQRARQPGRLRPVLHHGPHESRACRAAEGTRSAVCTTSSLSSSGGFRTW